MLAKSSASLATIWPILAVVRLTLLKFWQEGKEAAL